MPCFWKNFEASTDLEQDSEAALVYSVQDEVDISLSSLYHWHYEPCWAIQDLLSKMPAKRHKDPRGWTRWLDAEIEERIEDMDDGYYDELWRWWSEDPAVAPIMVPLNSRGRVDKNNLEANPIWAGHHRLALAIEHGWTHVPVIYSILKDDTGIQQALIDANKRFGMYVAASLDRHYLKVSRK